MKKIILLFLILSSVDSIYCQEIKRRASVGFTPIPVDSVTAENNGMKAVQGVVITDILQNGTFHSLKAKNQDILLTINGIEILGIQELLQARTTLREGDKVQAVVLRNKKELKLIGNAKPLPFEESEYSEIIYDHFKYKNGLIRTIINKPEKAGIHPVIFFIPGYTCTSIDNPHPIHPYSQLLEGFVELGYAIFRIEKPGVGDNVNTGDCNRLGFDNELQAYIEAYQQLKKYDFIDIENIFLWGHSMGGIYAPLMAKKFNPKGVIVYGIIHDTWTEYLLRMVRYQNPRIGASDYISVDEDLRILYPLLYEHYYLGKSSKELAENVEYKRILERDFFFNGEDQILFRHEDFWRELYEYNLSEAWAGTKSFVLSMNGEADLEVLNDFSQREIIDIVNHYNPGKGEFYYLPETDHSMIKVGTLEEGARLRSQPEYRQLIENNFNKDIVTKTHSWIQDKLGKSINKDSIKPWYKELNLSLLESASLDYDIIWNGEVAGSMDYNIFRDGNSLAVNDTSQLNGVVWEKLDLLLDLENFGMQEGQVRLNYIEQGQEISGDISWHGTTIEGLYNVTQSGQAQEIPLELETSQVTVARGAIFALISALPIEVGKSFSIPLFSFPQGNIWDMTLSIEEITSINWRNESYEVYKLYLSGGQVNNTIYMASGGSRRLLKIDVEGQNMSIVLNE